jgi:hypothetical protein
MRSLTSPHTKRISGPRKFRSSPQKDFCNNIRQQQKWNNSFNHLVCTREWHWRHGDAERFGSLEIDDEIELGRLHDRQIGRLDTLENFSGVQASLAVRSADTGSVTHQATGGDELTREVNHRDRLAGRQRCDFNAPTEEKRIGTDEEHADLLPDEARENGVDVLVGAGVQDMELQSERAC